MLVHDTHLYIVTEKLSVELFSQKQNDLHINTEKTYIKCNKLLFIKLTILIIYTKMQMALIVCSKII
jgi:hypothetical protein